MDSILWPEIKIHLIMLGIAHRLQTPNERINQRNLKFWDNVADKICFGRTYKFGIGILFSAVQWRRFPHQASVVRGIKIENEYLVIQLQLARKMLIFRALQGQLL